MPRCSSLLIAVVTLGLISGCATQAQRQFQAIKTKNQEILAQLKACVNTVHNMPEYSPLLAHLPTNLQSVTLEQLSDKSFATPEQARAIFATHPHLQACRKTFLDGVVQSEPSLVPIFIAAYSKSDDAAVALTQRKITWGDYVRGLRDRGTETQATVQAEDRHVVSELKEEHQAEMARRERAAEALAQWAQTQQMINAMNRPVITNCTGFGSMVNCFTR